MKIKILARSLFALALAFGTGLTALADTIRLKDGSVIRGQIVGFRDQQFVVLTAGGARGRRSRITIYMEEVDSIEFDAAGTTAEGGGPSGGGGGADEAPAETAARPQPTRPAPSTQTPSRPSIQQPPPSTTPASDSSQFFPVRLRVRADNAANGWTDSGLMVRQGQRLRISASGRVSLGQGRFSTPTGLPRVADRDKLMRDEPTGGLIAVIGDDNDEFIFVGAGREFVAPRDGRLFLGVNEGNLEDNTGNYDATVEVEPVGSARR